MRSATPAAFAASPEPSIDDARDWHDAKASARETTASDVVVFIDGRRALRLQDLDDVVADRFGNFLEPVRDPRRDDVERLPLTR